MNIKIKKLFPDAQVPAYQSEGAACFDLHAYFPEEQRELGARVTPECPAIISTGVAFEIPPGHVMHVYSRSGHGFKSSVRLGNCVGVIDSDYRDQVYVKLTADAPGRLDIRHGERIAQAMIAPAPQVTFEVVETLSETARGTNGLGSTGA